MNNKIPLKFRLVAAGLHVIAAIPLSICVVPILWIITKKLHPFVDRSGKDALNYSLNAFIGSIVSLLMCMFVFSITCGSGQQDPTLVLLSLTVFSCVVGAYCINSIAAGISALSGYNFKNRLIYSFFRSE